MIVVSAVLLFLYQVAWQSEIRVWGGGLYLLEFLLFCVALQSQWRIFWVYSFVFILASLLTLVPLTTPLLFILYALSLTQLIKRWVDPHNRALVAALSGLGVTIFLSLQYFLTIHTLSIAFWGSVLLLLPALFLYGMYPVAKRGLA